jgi:hypothetical protein
VGWIEPLIQLVGVPQRLSVWSGLLLEIGICVAFSGLAYLGLSGSSIGDFASQQNVDALWLAPIVPAFLAFTRLRHWIQKWAFSNFLSTHWACVLVVVVSSAATTWAAYYGIPEALVHVLAGENAVSTYPHDKGFLFLGVVVWYALVASARRDLRKLLESNDA